ncbi:MAG: aminoacetone oxidase family FAD-binding enzyme [Rhodobacterales bacterium]|nr:MAG: aminoacetone oxidase family FAD-binding enzyme [Rhodobacterales bacterium]
MADALVIGAGPAGLMAAQMLAEAGVSVQVVDAMPSVGRKLLMAGKSGLNLTKDEPPEQFLAQYDRPEMQAIVRRFDNADVQRWARDLGQELFTGSSGRVFPKAMKASPLLRAWLKRLAQLGVRFDMRWRWVGWGQGFVFDTPQGRQERMPKVAVLALGGASWARLGSDAEWAQIVAAKGVEIAPFQPANMGFCVDWSPFMAKHFGAPVKTVGLKAGDVRLLGEFVISRRGIEGSGIYALSRPMRQGAQLRLDLRPGVSLDTLQNRLNKPRGKASWANHLRKAARLDAVKLALLQEFGRPLPQQADQLAQLIKDLPIRHAGPRPMDEAISTAGGIAFSGLSPDLELRNAPGTFCAGEMLDWEAPTGGYLLTGCLATGRQAGLAAVKKLRG